MTERRRSTDTVVVAVLPQSVRVGLTVGAIALAGAIGGLYIALNDEASLREANHKLALQNHRLAVNAEQESKSVARSLCTFRQDLQRRVATTAKFLRENPAGIAGVPPATLHKSLSDQKQTILALQNLTC